MSAEIPPFAVPTVKGPMYILHARLRDPRSPSSGPNLSSLLHSTPTKNTPTTRQKTQVPTWKLRATFRDHSLGVQALSYLRGTLLSAGFDWEIIAWDADRLERIGSMAGHKAPVTTVAQVVQLIGGALAVAAALSSDHVMYMRALVGML